MCTRQGPNADEATGESELYVLDAAHVDAEPVARIAIPQRVPTGYHSWWIPDLGGKYDAIPGKINKTWFKAPVGTYVARCSELCGLQHALMTAEVDVVPRAEYDKFISTRASSAGAAT